MRVTLSALVLSVAVGAAPALAQNPTQMLQGLLSGNQNQDQAVRDAYERGYRAGRQDQAQSDQGRRPPPPDRQRYDADPNQYPRNQYGR